MSSKIRFTAAMAAAKCARTALKLLRREGSYLPGLIAIKLCPDFLGHLKLPEKVICVTGTNGKTTTSNLLTSSLRSAGYTVTNNSAGSNVQAGVATTLIADANLSGRVKTQIAVLEVDERSSLLVYKYITPDILVCNNIMRDSLKRNAHTEFISFIINKAVPASAHVFLNADDFICSRLVPQCKKRTYFGITAEKPESGIEYKGRDIVYCPECGTRLKADFIRYDHIGKLVCPGCGITNPVPDFAVESIDREKRVFYIRHGGKSEAFRLVNDNIVNIYNCCATVAVLYAAGLDYNKISKPFDDLKIVKSRYESLSVNGINLTMQLAKGQNPVACARAYSYVTSCPGENKTVIIMVDDKGDNTNNSESVCWIYDCDYTPLANPSVGHIIFAGKRCRDQKLRAMLAGVREDIIDITDSLPDAVSFVDFQESRDILICFDPYILAEAQSLKNTIIKKAGEVNRIDS